MNKISLKFFFSGLQLNLIEKVIVEGLEPLIVVSDRIRRNEFVKADRILTRQQIGIVILWFLLKEKHLFHDTHSGLNMTLFDALC
jgi:hypothetical protein